MFKIIIILVAILALFHVVMTFGTVDTTEINFSTVNSGTFDQNLRAWINTLNLDIANSGGLYNVGTGKIFYVDSDSGSSAFTGQSIDRAKSTLNEAVDLCTSNRGDVIYIAQGYSATMGAAADEVDIDAHGITIVGLGTGTLRPLFDYTGDVSAAFTIDADNITIINCVFNANILDVNDGIYIKAGSTDCAIIDCSFTVTLPGTDEFHESINSAGAASDRLLIEGCIFRQGAGAAVAALHMLDSDGFIFRNNIVQGSYSTATIFGETTASTDILIVNNIFSDSSADTLNIVAASTGFVARNVVAMEDTVANAFDIGNCWNVDNKLILDDDVTGALGSAAEATSYTSSVASAE